MKLQSIQKRNKMAVNNLKKKLESSIFILSFLWLSPHVKIVIPNNKPNYSHL